MGHRGCRGLRPENTLAGFQHAMALGVSGFEFDIAVTADGVPVLYHDPALNPDITRGSDHSWLAHTGPAISSLRLDQLGAYDVGRIRPGSGYAAEFSDQVPVDGARIPTLAALAALVASAPVAVRLTVELKTFPDRPGLAVAPPEMAAAVVSVLDAHGLVQHSMIQSFDWRSLDWLAANRPDVARAYLTSPRTMDALWLGGRVPDGRPAWQLVLEAGGRGWSPAYRSLTEVGVAAARAAGVSVVPWTVNRTADMAALIDWGVDGIITDRPDRLRAVLAERQMGLPQRAA